MFALCREECVCVGVCIYVCMYVGWLAGAGRGGAMNGEDEMSRK